MRKLKQEARAKHVGVVSQELGKANVKCAREKNAFQHRLTFSITKSVISEPIVDPERREVNE